MSPKKKTSKSKNRILTPTREVLYAPWRYGYIKGTHKDDNGPCVFCESVKMGPCFESLILHKGKTASVFLNKFPYNNGHMMVIPHRHTAEFTKLSNAEFEELHLLLKRASHA